MIKINKDKVYTAQEESLFWNKFYDSDLAPSSPSNFAKLSLEYVDKTKSLVEFGCGNGRDSFFFAQNGINIISLDRSKTVVAKNSMFEAPNVSFKEMDFTRIPENELTDEIGGIYSRFTLHSINKEGYNRTIRYCGEKLPKGAKLFIEARTINDPLFGKGEKYPDNGFKTTHYRRFLEIKEVISDVLKAGFKLELAIEDYLDCWYKDDHAVVLRIIAQKI